nr:RNA-directed DNA polymerase, eukaryota [Tanacetum cinerariifolium]
MLANWMVKVIDDLVHPVQSTFVKGRQILDGPMVINEIMVWMGFNEKLIQWIRACLSSSRASVLVNGSRTKELSLQRGLRQGDPLSPFLFILVMEGLHVAMEDAVKHGFSMTFGSSPMPEVVNKKMEALRAQFFWGGDHIFGLVIRTLKKFPRVFALEMAKGCSVADRWRVDNWNWNWIRIMHTEGRTGQQVLDLLFVLQGIEWSENEDVWRWEVDQEGEYSRMKDKNGSVTYSGKAIPERNIFACSFMPEL